MKRAGLILTAIFLLSVFRAAPVFSEEEAKPEWFHFSGYYKFLPAEFDVPAIPVLEPGGQYSDWLNRLRLGFDFNLSPNVKAEIDYDVEARFGDFVKSNFFGLAKMAAPKPYFEVGETVQDSNPYLEHYLYRGFLTVSLPGAEVKVGRQTIDWGTGLAWNPTNPFFPVSPLTIEKEEMVGIDAFSLEFPLSSLSSLQVVVAGRDGLSLPATAAHYRANLGGTDLSLVVYNDQEKSLAGLDFSRPFLKAEVHGSVVQTNGKDDDFTSFTLGANYAFPSKLKLGLEYFHNGKGESDKADYDFLGLLLGKEQFIAENYLFFGLDYEITPLLKLQCYTVRNLDDNGTFINPVLSYALTGNSELSAGWAGFDTEKGDEFSYYPDTWYLQYQIYF
jgi:hypothetical protein